MLLSLTKAEEFAADVMLMAASSAQETVLIHANNVALDINF
jgi:hypothetical protein